MSTPRDAQTFEDRHHFLLRKLHSLSGIVPIGVFLIEHLLTNSMAWYGGSEKYNQSVSFIRGLPYLPLLEVFGIFLPIAFHAVYGIKIAMTAQPNVAQYPYLANRRYLLQRVTGYIAFLFLIVHLGKFRFAHWIGLSDHHFLETPGGAFFEATRAGFVGWKPWGLEVATWMVVLFYVVGLWAACYHFANGIWSFCVSWGITVGEKAQRRVGIGAAAVGVLLFFWGCMSLYAFASPTPQARVEHETMAVQAAESDAAAVRERRIVPDGSRR